MRILWSSNAPWAPSGYGVQTKLVLDRLVKHHEMALYAWYGIEGGLIHFNGIPTYPKIIAPYGQDGLGPHAQHFRADLAITLIDAWVQDPDSLPAAVRWAPWFPVDSDPISPRIVEKVSKAFERLVFSRFACRQLDDKGLTYEYIPHCVDLNVYNPMSETTEEVRARMGMAAGKFLVGIVAANKGLPSRKSWAQAIEAFGTFHKRHPDAHLYIHSNPTGSNGGVDMVPLLNFFGLDPSCVTWTDQYQMAIGIPDVGMNSLYNAFDVLLNPAMGEGFGVPILEAQAAGCPVIVGDWTAMSELCWSGLAIPREDAEATWIPGYDTVQFAPHAGAIAEALEKAYEQRFPTRHRPDEVLPYDADAVVRDYWLPALARMQARIQEGAAPMELVSFQ